MTVSVPTSPGQVLAVKTRFEFVDNLRWVMIVLVVSMHAAVTDSHVGPDGDDPGSGGDLSGQQPGLSEDSHPQTSALRPKK